MSTADTELDVIRAFTAALTPAARHALELNYDSIRYIRAATGHHTPAELARIVSAGIGRQNPANPSALILFRLRRESGLDDDQEDND